MNYLQNHCWCSKSHWDNLNYYCRHIVSLSSYEDGYKEDWDTLIIEKNIKDYIHADTFKQYYLEKHPELWDEMREEIASRTINTLKPEVLEWLTTKVEDTKDNKGWCIGSDEYLSNDSSISFSIFFQRRKDAMRFIKTWSKWKKPIHYCQYFTDVRKKLNLEKLKYETV